MTNFPAADEPIDPEVRSLLWRLRARLVIPPNEVRAAEDLEQILAAASDAAHEPAAGSGSGTAPVRLEPVTELRAARGWSRGQSLTRVAAAAVLIVAVGSGVGSARDGDVIDVLLGRTGAPTDAGPTASPTDPLAGSDAPVAKHPEPTPVPLVEDASEAPDTPSESPAGPDASDSSEPSDPAGSDDGAGPTDGDDAAGTDGTDDAAPTDRPAPSGDGPAAEPAPAPTPAPSPAPRDEPSEDEAPRDTVVAAPAPGDVDGFAGPQPCREDQDLAACLDERTGQNEPADGSPGTDEPSDDDGSTDDEADGEEPNDPADDGSTADEQPASEQEKLARRRGAG